MQLARLYPNPMVTVNTETMNGVEVEGVTRGSGV